MKLSKYLIGAITLCGFVLLGYQGCNVHAQVRNNVNINQPQVSKVVPKKVTNLQKSFNKTSANININENNAYKNKLNNKPIVMAKHYNPMYENNNLGNNYNHYNRKRRYTRFTPKKYNHITHVHKVNYYTYINSPSKHQKGYGIYTAPYGTTKRSFKAKTWQRKIANQTAHIVKTGYLKHKLWVDMRSKISGWMNANGTIQSTRWLKVPLVAQRPQLPTGCEITAVTMMLKYRGDHVNKVRLAEQMPRSSNGNYGFVGSPFSSSGWWIFPPALMGLVNHYTHHHAINMTGWSLASVKRQIRRQKPVVIWVANMDGFPNHALTVYGYTKHDLMYNDPWLDRRVWMNAHLLWQHHSLDDLRAISYR